MPYAHPSLKAERDQGDPRQVSQSVFATYLNVTSGLVSNWDRGEKRPSGASLKLLSLVEKKAWPPLRKAANIAKHGVGFDEASMVFGGPHVIVRGRSHG